MQIPEIPQDPKEWNVDKLNELIKFVGIESNDFDFKKEPNELEQHICAMANSDGGFLILGITQILSNDKKRIIRFEKRGFAHGKEDDLKNKITNSVLGIEPMPPVSFDPIYEKDEKKFYMVIKIGNRISDKPYFVKSTDQCFVRIQNSKIRANRSIIFNLFSTSIEQRQNLERLKSACTQTKEAFRFAVQDVRNVSETSTMKIPPLELSYLRNVSLSCEWFLREKNLWGEHTEQSSYTHGINSVLHDLELLNIYIKSYNLAVNLEERGGIKTQLSSWYQGGGYDETIRGILDKIIDTIDKFLR